MRVANVAEAEMNALFNYTKQYSEELFSPGRSTANTIGAFEGANYEATGLLSLGA